MNLEQALQAIAAQLNLNADDLIRYANEDRIGGYDPDPLYQSFPTGSIWGVEGQILYALTRAQRAQRIVEIGGWAGCSATHFAAAVQANGGGIVISVDNGSELSHVSGAHGNLIPPDYRNIIELVNADGIRWLTEQEDHSIDILFDDAAHTPEVVSQIAWLAQTKLRPGGVLVAHDAMHFRIGEQVRAGLALAGVDYRAYLIEPADCGLAVWRVPGSVAQPEPLAVEVVKFQGIDLEIIPGYVDLTPITPSVADYEHVAQELGIETDDLAAEVHASAPDPELLPEPVKKKRGRPKKAAN